MPTLVTHLKSSRSVEVHMYTMVHIKGGPNTNLLWKKLLKGDGRKDLGEQVDER